MGGPTLFQVRDVVPPLLSQIRMRIRRAAELDLDKSFDAGFKEHLKTCSAAFKKGASEWVRAGKQPVTVLRTALEELLGHMCQAWLLLGDLALLKRMARIIGRSLRDGMLDDVERFQELAREADRQVPSADEFAAAMQEGRARFRAGEHRLALDAFLTAQLKYPPNSNVVEFTALLSNIAKANSRLMAAPGLSPPAKAAMYHQGLTAAEQQSELAPSITAFYNIGRLHSQMQMYAKACAALNKGLGLPDLDRQLEAEVRSALEKDEADTVRHGQCFGENNPMYADKHGLHQEEHSTLEILPAGERGRGVWAKHGIMKGALITEVAGQLLSEEEMTSLQERAPRDPRLLYAVEAKDDGHKFFILPETEPEVGQGLGAFVNDPRGTDNMTANCTFFFDVALGSRKIYVQATRDIFPGEQLLVKYGTKWWLKYEAITGRRPPAEEEDEAHAQPPTPKRQRVTDQAGCSSSACKVQ